MEHDTKPVTISIHAGLAKCCSTSVQLLIGAECKALAMQEVQKNQKSTHLRIFCGLNSTGKLAIQGDYAELMETLLVRFFDRDVERIENAKKVITFLNTICLREERLPDKFYEKLISHLTLLCDACGKSNRQITFILSSENLSPNPFNDGDYRYIDVVSKLDSPLIRRCEIKLVILAREPESLAKSLMRQDWSSDENINEFIEKYSANQKRFNLSMISLKAQIRSLQELTRSIQNISIQCLCLKSESIISSKKTLNTFSSFIFNQSDHSAIIYNDLPKTNSSKPEDLIAKKLLRYGISLNTIKSGLSERSNTTSEMTARMIAFLVKNLVQNIAASPEELRNIVKTVPDANRGLAESMMPLHEYIYHSIDKSKLADEWNRTKSLNKQSRSIIDKLNDEYKNYADIAFKQSNKQKK